MSIFKNLVYALFGIALVSLILVLLLLRPTLAFIPAPIVSGPVAIFSVAIVAMCVCLVLYYNQRSAYVKVLKRRAGLVYGELMQYKMKLIDVLDGQKPFVDSEKYLYSDDTLQRVRRFIGEEYFLLLQFEPFFMNSSSAKSVLSFYGLHKDLATFVRSVDYDRIDFNKFKALYEKIWDHPLTKHATEEHFQNPELTEAYDAIVSSREALLTTTENLMSFLDKHLIDLDKYFTEGVSWSVTKSGYDSEFQMWMYTNS